MAQSRLEIIVAAKDLATGTLKNVGAELKGISGVGSMLSGSLSSMLAPLTGVGIVGAVAGIGKLTWGLNQAREESAQAEARFTAFAGGVRQASRAITEMDKALGLALTRDEKMAAAGELLGLGLARDAQEAANLTRWALLLGDAQLSAGQRIEAVTRILETGRLTGLVPYGISIQDVKARIDELQRAQRDLSEIEASQIAIKEALARKAEEVAAAGGQEATETRKLSNAWGDFKDALADTINLTPGVQALAAVIARMTKDLTDTGRAQTDAEIASKRYAETLVELEEAQLNLQAAIEMGNEREVERARANVEATRTAVGLAKAEADHAQTMLQIAEGTYEAVDAERDYIAQMAASTEATREATAASNELRIARASVPTERLAQAAGIFSEADRNLEEWKRKRIQAGQAAGEAAERAQVKAAKASASAWDRAFEQVKGTIAGALSGAQGALSNLLPDMFKGNAAPGANGPFEGLFRAADVARLGGASPWAAVLGLDQAQATKIVRDFQAGLITSEVEALIDVNALVNQAQMQQAAQQLTTSFTAKIAAAAGTSKESAVAAIFGGQTGITTGAEGVVTTVADTIMGQEDQLVATGTSAIEMIAAGITGASGTLSSAAESVVREMLAAMARAVAGSQPPGGNQPTGGSVSGAARAAGVV
jgi:hypothetical protein